VCRSMNTTSLFRPIWALGRGLGGLASSTGVSAEIDNTCRPPIRSQFLLCSDLVGHWDLAVLAAAPEFVFLDDRVRRERAVGVEGNAIGASLDLLTINLDFDLKLPPLSIGPHERIAGRQRRTGVLAHCGLDPLP
jgi:hypothetical protein